LSIWYVDTPKSIRPEFESGLPIGHAKASGFSTLPPRQ
jgi:hypothetical protein